MADLIDHLKSYVRSGTVLSVDDAQETLVVVIYAPDLLAMAQVAEQFTDAWQTLVHDKKATSRVEVRITSAVPA